MLSGKALLREAASHYTTPLANSAKAAWKNGFVSGAEWMRLAMKQIRNTELPAGRAGFQRLGLIKYGASCTGACLALIAGWMLHPTLIILAIPAFYLVEVQWVFLFPAALDGATSPWIDSRRLMNRRAGTISAFLIVLPIALEMLIGGLRGRGFIRSWSLGCLAVLVWYERCRHEPILEESEEWLPPLDTFHRAPLLLRRERLMLPITESVKCLLVSDLHLTSGRGEALLTAIDRALEVCKPEVLILAGDLADSLSGLELLKTHLTSWSRQIPVLAVPGNHDEWIGLNRVRSMVAAAGAIWLPDDPYVLKRHNHAVMAFAALEAWPHPNQALPIVAVLHDPAHYWRVQKQGAALAMAGHLHGGQMVWTRNNAGRLLPAGWIYRLNVLRFKHAQCELVVSRGCADTLPVRWRCPREVVLCELEPGLE